MKYEFVFYPPTNEITKLFRDAVEWTQANSKNTVEHHGLMIGFEQQEDAALFRIFFPQAYQL